VSQLSQLIEGMLESTFHSLWVAGEISDVTRPHSGHVYFTLRDDAAQIRAVIWRSVASRLKFQVEEGQQVVCRGDIDVYPPRGTYQLVVQQVEPRGLGALQLALKQLQRRLEAEGLFDPARKRPLPPFPRRVGFVTSPTGAAIRDFLQVAARRFHGVRIFVIPARVQGEGAAAEIARGIAVANRLRPPLDVLVVGRGGGSPEDLWCFNDEQVVRAIFASQIPVVSAVGHEIDVTLADLVADVRALTPSEAAERVIPSAEELTKRLATFQRRIISMLRAKAASARRHVEQLGRSRVLRNPRALVYDLSRRLDELDSQAIRAIRRRLKSARDQLAAIACRADALSPLAVLGRGFSVTTDANTGAVLTSTDRVEIGQRVQTRLSKGSFISRVEP
jgi:exodeoxyribonuclease VII large subunit